MATRGVHRLSRRAGHWPSRRFHATTSSMLVAAPGQVNKQVLLTFQAKQSFM